MPNLTLSVSSELKEKMDRNKVINWSEVARKAIEKKLNETLSEEEKENINWAVRLQRAGRSGRLEALKKRGLI
ncbi:MAG: hypothetical protein Q7S56_02845 [Nanoarchaeota archaeon]|nr:hypothetical protein [Nanoarchaeota archaeon]